MNDNKVKIGTEHYNQILDRNIAWIENCDTKASIILGGIGVIFGILLASDYVKKIIEVLKNMTDNM